jgi:hypothetical protein
VRYGDAGETLMIRGAGETNRTHSYTREINLSPETKKASESGYREGQPELSVRVEAF